jgi:ubiquinone/menaquinone biosynthesis C-methylase UbiE
MIEQRDDRTLGGKPAARQRPIWGQFAHPTGRLGWWVGQLMAWKNAPQNEAALEWLSVQPEDAVLEIGSGPGDLVRRIAARTPRGFVAGVDPSAVMVRQATERNREAVTAGRVQLALGGVSQLPFPDGRFDKAVAVNSFQFWPRPVEDLTEVRRVLRSGGLLLLCLRMAPPPGRLALAPGFTEEQVAAIEEQLRQAGFRQVRRAKRHLAREITGLFAIAP